MVLLGAMSQPHTKDVFSPYFPNIEDKDLVKISQAGNLKIFMCKKDIGFTLINQMQLLRK